jgi:hypothetical protein
VIWRRALARRLFMGWSVNAEKIEARAMRAQKFHSRPEIV